MAINLKVIVWVIVRYCKFLIFKTLLFTQYSKEENLCIAKFKMNAYKLHSETGYWTIPKTMWVERTFHLCATKNIEDESHFLLECCGYTHIRYMFHNLCYNTNLGNFLTCQNYVNVHHSHLLLEWSRYTHSVFSLVSFLKSKLSNRLDNNLVSCVC